MIKFIWFVEAAFLVILSFPIATLPYKIALKVGEILGLLVFYLWGSRRKIAVANIERVEQIEPFQWGTTIKSSSHSKSSGFIIVKESFKNLGRSFVEVIKIYYGLGKEIIDNVEIKGIDNYNKAKLKGRGVIFITGHCGNWELMAVTFGVKVDNVSVVARAQNNPYLNKFLEKIRAKYGNKVIYKRGALKGILSELRKNRGVGILMDQAVLKDEGYVINFLGMPAWTTKMPALMARKTGAAIIPIFINRDGDRHVIHIYPEVALSTEDDVEKAIIEDTKRFSGFIEEYIRRHPTEWLWIHKRWKRTKQ